MEWYTYPIIIFGGVLAGFINTLAGSGSLITVPLLIFFGGLEATIANATNRVAILFQNIVGVRTFHAKEVLDTKGVIWLGIPAVFGSILGAWIASITSADIFKTIFGYVMILMLFVIVLRPKKWLSGDIVRIKERPTILQIILLFFIGIYGGFIQAGVGIILLSSLVLGVGYDLVRGNAVKVGIILFFTIFALAVFVYKDQVRWDLGLTLAIGNMIGAWIGARIAVEKGAIWVRRLLIAIVLISSLKMLGIVNF